MFPDDIKYNRKEKKLTKEFEYVNKIYGVNYDDYIRSKCNNPSHGLFPYYIPKENRS